MLPGASVGLNTAFNVATNLLGVRFDPYQVSHFMVEIEGILAGSFSECSGLQIETTFEEYQEGGVNDYIHRFAGTTKSPPLILKHGITSLTDGLWNWHQDIVNQKIERKNGTIYLLNKKRIPVIWWNFKNAFPYKWVGPNFQANSGDVAFESVELVHQGLSRPTLSGLLSGIGAGFEASLDVSIGGGF
ncbi:MAG: phage tail protein [Cyanobacteria bacterium P01_F01_bin.150]